MGFQTPTNTGSIKQSGQLAYYSSRQASGLNALVPGLEHCPQCCPSQQGTLCPGLQLLPRADNSPKHWALAL